MLSRDPAGSTRPGGFHKRNIPVIPVLLDRTRMPSEAEVPPSLGPLVFRNAIDVDQGRDFHPHVDRLVRGIEFYFERAKTNRAETSSHLQKAVERAPIPKVPHKHPQQAIARLFGLALGNTRLIGSKSRRLQNTAPLSRQIPGALIQLDGSPRTRPTISRR